MSIPQDDSPFRSPEGPADDPAATIARLRAERDHALAALRHSEADARFLAALGERIRLAREAEELLYEVSRAAGDYLEVRRSFFVEIDEANDRGFVRRDYCRGVESVAGEYKVSEYSPTTRAEAAAGRIIVNCDSREDPRTAASYASTYERYGERAYVAVPLMREGRWDATFWVSTDEPRRWQPREIALLEALAERTWNAVETLRLDAALRADIARRKEVEEALRETDRRKDEFLAMLAHELRNPLAPIRNAAHVLKLVGGADARQQWAREVIERQTQHLTRLVDDLLDVSRITRGKITLVREPLDLALVIHRAVETSRPLLEARRHRWTVSLPPGPVRIEGDLTRLVQVIGNLLNNAAKFTDEGGNIEIEAGQEGEEAILRVRDDGMGIPSDLLPHVFDLFAQADRSLDRSQGGLGIGLTLVRRLVELHGGRVEARSDGPGRGSEFIVRLPAAVPPAGEAAADGAEPARPAAAGLRILVVEDNPDSARMLSFLLELEGHETRMACDGPAAIEAARAFLPRVVLCDIGLPGMNGYEVAQQLRALPQMQELRLIALTGYGQEEDRRRAAAAGFDDHLTKPVEPETLVALLETVRSRSPSATATVLARTMRADPASPG